MYVALRLKQDVCGIKSETRCMWHYVWNNMYVALSLNNMYVALRLKQYVCGI